MKINHSDLDRRIRTNKGRRMLEDWMSEFGHISDTSVRATDFLTLDETDRMRGVFARNAKSSTALHIFWTIGSNPSEVDALVSALLKKHDKVTLFHKADSLIGALTVSTGALLTHIQAIRHFLGGDISLVTIDGESGLCLERTLYDNKRDYVASGIWEITVWGVFAADSIISTLPNDRKGTTHANS